MQQTGQMENKKILVCAQTLGLKNQHELRTY
jgi:hypothetical protein